MQSSFPSRSLSAPPAANLRARPVNIAAQLRYLVRSAEPAVVFSSLAHLCVPTFSDACIIDIVEHGEIAYRIAQYRSDLDPDDVSSDRAPGRSVCTPFAPTTCTKPDASYAGVMTHWWRSRHPTGAEQAQSTILARHCVATVAEERHLGDPRRGHDTVEQRQAARAHRPLVPWLGCRGAVPGEAR